MKQKISFTTIVILTTIAFVMLANPGIVFSSLDSDINQLKEKIKSKREKIDQIEESIEKYNEKAKEMRKQAVSLKNQIDIIENRKAQIKLEIKETNSKINTLNLKLDKINKEIQQTKEEITKQKKMVMELIRVLHRKQGKNSIEVLTTYDSISEFYNRIQYLESIEQDLSESTKVLKETKKKLKKEKKQKESIKKSFQEMKEKLENKKKDLKDQEELKEQILEKTQKSELKYKTLVSDLRSKYQKVESEIRNIEQSVREKVDKKKLQKKVKGNPEKLSWPTQSRYITAGFKDEDYPFKHVMEHTAVDIRAAQGTPVKAAASGYVGRAKRCDTSSCFSFVMLIHDSGISTVYGHLSNVKVQEDQFVSRGETIGLSGGAPGTIGSGPWSTGSHVHMEVRKNGIPKNPLDYLVEDY